nr:winged helix-turn-helix transcriptional regulator [Hymenobacter radiodurans]
MRGSSPDGGLDLLREVTAGKWKISLLYFIGQGLRRPSQLHQRLPGAAPRMLNLQLRQLLAHELLRKQTVSAPPHGGVPPHGLGRILAAPAHGAGPLGR